MIDYDSELRLHQQALRHAHDVRPTDHVLDIGCGAGQTTREAARIARDGYALGIDIAKPLLRDAQRLTRVAGVGNVRYVCGDAARLPFLPASFDLAISRFGTMFFANPESAFANIRSALRPEARLIMMVWQEAPRNEWTVAIHRALVNDATAMPTTLPGPSAFSLGEMDAVNRTLQAAGFADVEFAEVHEPVYYGPDIEGAVAFVSQFSNVASVIAVQPQVDRDRLVARLHDLMTAHCKHDGVWFDSRAWIVKAKCG